MTKRLFIGARVKRLMASKDMSYKELASKLDAPQANIKRYVRDNRLPKNISVEQLACAIGTTVGYITGEENLKDDVYTQISDLIDANLKNLTFKEKEDLILKIVGSVRG